MHSGCGFADFIEMPRKNPKCQYDSAGHDGGGDGGGDGDGGDGGGDGGDGGGDGDGGDGGGGDGGGGDGGGGGGIGLRLSSLVPRLSEREEESLVSTASGCGCVTTHEDKI